MHVSEETSAAAHDAYIMGALLKTKFAVKIITQCWAPDVTVLVLGS